MVGVRIPDDELALLDQHVGVNGMRSRSDVIRRGLRLLFEAQPALPSMKSVTIELGTAQQFQLKHLLEMKGQTPEMAINEALNSYLSQVVEDLAALNEQYESTANEIRARVTRSKEFGQ
jgi:Arc/MetJ-type ribon-helix-helix transcriptional regulator